MSIPLPTTPWGPLEAELPTTKTGHRILDAAGRLFARHGVSATTMEQIARETGISRVWLYRHFANRDAVIRSLFHRETMRRLEELANHIDRTGDPVEVAINVTTFALDQLRRDRLIPRLFETEHAILLPFFTIAAGPLLEVWVRAAARYFVEFARLDDDDALLVAEWIVRMATSVLLTPRAAVDLDDARILKRFVARGVKALVEHPDTR